MPYRTVEHRAAQHEAPATGKLLPVTGAPADANDWVGTVEVRAGAATREVPPRPVRAARWTAPLPPAGFRVPDELAADVRRRAGFPVSGRERDLRSTNSFHASEDCPPGSIRAETAWCPCGVAVGVVRQRVCALHRAGEHGGPVCCRVAAGRSRSRCDLARPAAGPLAGDHDTVV